MIIKNLEKILKNIIAKYHDLLSIVLRSKYLTLIGIGILIVISGYVAMQLPKRIFPDDPNRKVIIHVVGSTQNTPSSLEKKLTQFSQFYQSKLLSNAQ